MDRALTVAVLGRGLGGPTAAGPQGVTAASLDCHELPHGGPLESAAGLYPAAQTQLSMPSRS